MGTERFTYTQKVPSEAAFHDAANEHFLLLLLLALLGSSSGGVEGSRAFLLPGLALRPFSSPRRAAESINGEGKIV